VASSEWRETVYQKLRLRRAVIPLCSKTFVASEWCLSEAAIETDQGRALLPLLIVPAGELPKLLQHIQAIDFSTIHGGDCLPGMSSAQDWGLGSMHRRAQPRAGEAIRAARVMEVIGEVEALLMAVKGSAGP
jgi:hypothetical protein